jgi:hypothetical protein
MWPSSAVTRLDPIDRAVAGPDGGEDTDMPHDTRRPLQPSAP